MKFNFLTAFFVLFVAQYSFAQNQFDPFFELADDFFVKHIVNGTIDFDKQKIDEKLNHLIKQIRTADLTETNTSTQVAFLINAYNLHALNEIKKLLPLNHTVYYNDFFHKTVIEIAGEKFTFNQLRNERLAFVATNPLFHFALIQAGLSFPMLPDYAFTPNELDEQLEAQTRKVINHPDFLKKEQDKVILPQFLMWYKKDLIGKKNSILQFINYYYHLESKTLKFIHRVKYDEVRDWTLNYYLQAIKTSDDTKATKAFFKYQFNQYLPSVLIKPGSIEILSLNNGTQNERYDVSPNFQYRRRSISCKFGINQLFNLGLLYNYSYSDPNSFGPQFWFIPVKKRQNFILEFGLMFPLFQSQLSDVHNSIDTKINGYSFYNKFKYWHASSDEFYLDVDIGLSVENSNTYAYENLRMISMPVNFSYQFYISQRLRLHTKFNYSPFQRKFLRSTIKGYTIFNQTGLSFQFSKTTEVSFLYGFFRNRYNSISKLSAIVTTTDKWRDFNIDFRFSF